MKNSQKKIKKIRQSVKPKKSAGENRIPMQSPETKKDSMPPREGVTSERKKPEKRKPLNGARRTAESDSQVSLQPLSTAPAAGGECIQLCDLNIGDRFKKASLNLQGIVLMKSSGQIDVRLNRFRDVVVHGEVKGQSAEKTSWSPWTEVERV